MKTRVNDCVRAYCSEQGERADPVSPAIGAAVHLGGTLGHVVITRRILHGKKGGVVVAQDRLETMLANQTPNTHRVGSFGEQVAHKHDTADTSEREELLKLVGAAVYIAYDKCRHRGPLR
jgi:hypothetical protein